MAVGLRCRYVTINHRVPGRTDQVIDERRRRLAAHQMLPHSRDRHFGQHELRAANLVGPGATERTAEQIERFLAAARETIAEVPHCWLATRSADGGTNARAVKSTSGAPGDDVWTRRFLVRRGSRKVAEMQEAPRVTLAYQHASGSAYVALGGHATIVEDNAEMRTLWPGSMDALFPPGFADANMIVVRVAIDRVEVHVRGVTREPFGHGRTLLVRNGGGWRFVPDY
jgi:general stress protein 26